MFKKIPKELNDEVFVCTLSSSILSSKVFSIPKALKETRVHLMRTEKLIDHVAIMMNDIHSEKLLLHL